MKIDLRILLLISLCVVLSLPACPTMARDELINLEEKVVAYVEGTVDRLTIPGIAVGILIITLFVFAGSKLPDIANDQRALLAIAVLASLKIVDAVIHDRMSRA
jgi:hypothetical protein